MIPNPKKNYTWTGLRLQRQYADDKVKTATRFQYFVTCKFEVQANLIIDAENEAAAQEHIREALSRSKLFVPDLDGWFVGGAVGLSTPGAIQFKPSPHPPLQVLLTQKSEERTETPAKKLHSSRKK